MRFKKLLSLALAVAMCLTVLPAHALAAEGPQTYQVSVSVNGELLQFPDAQPAIVGDRTMLPVRALTEAMGAEVEWFVETQEVRITLNDMVVSLTIGSPDITLEWGGTPSTATMDVAPFIDPATGRTYVPVRFISEAFGYPVDWDEATRTADVTTDPEILMARLTAGRNFGYMKQVQQLLAQGQEEQEGIRNTTLKGEGNMTVSGLIQIPITIGLEAVTEEQVGMEMTVGMTVDLSQMMFLLALMGSDALPAELKAMVDLFSQGGIRETFRGDLTTGEFYYTLSEGLLTAAGLDKNTWFKMDLGAMGGTYATLIGADASEDPTAWLQNALPTLGFAGLDELMGALCDESFARDEAGNLSAIWGTSDDETYVMAVNIDLAMVGDEMTGATVTFYRGEVEQEEQKMLENLVVLTIDAAGAVSGAMQMSGEGMTLELDFQAQTVEGDTPPRTEPPAGAVILDQSEAGSLDGLLGVSPLV